MRAHQRPGRVPCTVADCSRPLYAGGMCSMHYCRVRRSGDVGPPESLRGPRGQGSITPEGYHVICDPTHPLATAQGRVATHRAVLYAKLGPGQHPCHWCGVVLPWRGGAHVAINADHIDFDRLNNDPANLVPSCLDCNTKRGSRVAVSA